MSLNREKYKVFASLLQQLENFISSPPLDASMLRQQFVSLQQFCHQNIILAADEDTEALQGRILSYCTEISKQMRLLEIDVMFFQGARQASTVQNRLNSIIKRLQTLNGYCEAILAESGDGDRGTKG